MKRWLVYPIDQAMGLLIAAGIILTPDLSHADDSGFFFDAGAGAAFRFGSSDTQEGGGAIGGGGKLFDVSFDTAWRASGHVGYRLSSDLAFFLSYERIEGDVSWRANFDVADSSIGRFDGEAISNVILANVAYAPLDNGTTAVDLTLGAGIAINQLRDVVERYSMTTFFLEDNSEVSPAVQAGLAIRHEIAPWLHLGADASVAYYGDFRTGNSRKWADDGEMYVITPYEIDPVWGASVGGFVRLNF